MVFVLFFTFLYMPEIFHNKYENPVDSNETEQGEDMPS